MLRKEKEQVVADLAARLQGSDTLILADYRGLSVSELDDVRTQILEHGARFSVVKNSLTKRAAEEAGLPTLTELLDGPTAIAFVGEGDMVAVAKTLNETARKTKILSIKGGVLQGAPLRADQVVELAALPPADVLQGQVLGAIVGPLTGVLGLVSAPLQDLVGLLDARIDQLGGPEAAPAAAEEQDAATAGSVEATDDTSEHTADDAAEEPKEED